MTHPIPMTYVQCDAQPGESLTDWRKRTHAAPPRRTPILRYVLGVLCAFGVITAGTVALGAELAHADARPVSLAHASVPPARLALLPAHAQRTFLRQCPRGGYFTESSAYRWNGDAIGPQVWRADRTRVAWRNGRHSVTFDGLTFRNHSGAPVLVAGWCS